MFGFASVNFLKVLVAALTSFPLGWIWYSALFGKMWVREAGVTKMPAGNPGVVYGGMFALSFVSALVFAAIVGGANLGNPIATGFAMGLGLVATGLASNYLAAGRSLRLWWIDAGYHVMKFVLYGAVFALWK